MSDHRRLDILCTLGPASMNGAVIERLENLGTSLFRINLSHTKLADVEKVIRYVQGRTTVPICLDTEGAQIRTRVAVDGDITLEEHSAVRIGAALTHISAVCDIYPPEVFEQLALGDLLSIDSSDPVLVQVTELAPTGLSARVLNGGSFRSNKAVTVDRRIKLPALTEKDRHAVKIGRELGVRDFALSFANHESEVDVLRSLAGPGSRIIAKIESRLGVQNVMGIARSSDALLLDRGDMSREVPIEKIPRVQKYFLSVAKQAGVKAYVATNFLDSMKENLLPSRADVNDVFSTLGDGADGLVLAAETAIGRYPVQSAVMLSKIIRQQRASMESPHLPRVELDRAESCLLIDPHGGSLADSFHERSDPKSARKYPRLSVDVKTLTDAEQLAIGTYSPLAGFMSWEEMKSVLEDFKLPSGLVWPLPIVLQIHSDNARDLARSNAVALCLGDSNDAHAVVHIEDIYNYDLFKMARLMFGTANESHPGVRSLMKRGDWFVGGRVELLQRLPSPLKHFELTPRQTRAIFTGRGWTRIVGFHTRNIIHRAHEHIQMAALREQRCDGLFIRPVIGVKKQGDVEGAVIMKTYEAVVREHYPKAQVLLGSSQNYSRYAGPREAIFTALCHKNFGCTHFVVGRDHTGVGEYYGANDAHKAFADVGNIGIVPVLFDEIRYCMGCATYVVQCEREGHETMRISGTRARELLRTDALPPAWMMRSDVAQMVLDEKKQGTKVFV